jgi:exopolysaccharide production protein ExoQ
MNPQLAAFATLIAISWLLWLDRDDATSRTSRALWIPMVWIFLAGSRSASQWMQSGSSADYGQQFLEGNPLDRVVLTALLVSGLIVLAGRSSRVIALLKANTPIVSYFLYCALSTLWSQYPIVAFKRWFRSLGDLVMVLVLMTDPRWLRAVTRVFTQLGLVLLALSIVFIKYFPELGRTYGRWDGKTYWTGVSGHKNGLGMICLVLGLASLWRLVTAYRARKANPGVRHFIVPGVTLAMAVYLLSLIDSKTSLGCFFLGAMLIAALNSRSLVRRPVLLHSLVILSVGTAFAILFLNAGDAVLEAMGRDPGLTERKDNWHVMLRYAEHPLLGAGYESFWLGRRYYEIAQQTGVAGAHNGYLELYLNLGWVGLAFLSAVIGSGYRNAFAALRRHHDTGMLQLTYWLVGVIYNFTEAAFKMTSLMWIALLIGSMAASRTGAHSARRTSASPFRDYFYDATPTADAGVLRTAGAPASRSTNDV